jgi:alkanesulfonate monooxygenase SsuD/methylene tetrahydromethanopterin reductase-like flavin-dependent oxidoreductase (luciferase family)
MQIFTTISLSQEVQRRFNILKDHCFSVGREYNDIKRSIIFRCLIKVSEDQINDLISKEKDEHESVGSFIQRINAVIGTPEFIKNKIHEYIEIGVEKFIIHFVSRDNQSLRFFSSGVMTKNYKGAPISIPVDKPEI